MQQYLVYHEGKSFFTEWFDLQNNYVEGMIVFDLINELFICDDTGWHIIDEDHL